MKNLGYSIFGDGPQRHRHSHRKGYYSVPTEFHRTLCSFGGRDYTRRLPDHEFYRQYGEEVGYLFGESAKHFGSAVRSFGRAAEAICNLLFG